MDNNYNNNGVTNVTPNQYNSTGTPNQYNSYQTSNNQQLYNNQTQNNNTTPKKNNKIVIIIVIILIALIGYIVFSFLNKDKNNNYSNNDINYSTSFFIRNENDKYALFNDDGTKLTDFIFTYASDFINGTALVKKDDSYGIISSNGKMTVDFGKYEYITDEAGLYKVRGEDYHYFLINGSGKVLYDMENMDIDTFTGDDTFSILEDEKNNVYRVLNFEGKEMVSFPIVDSAKDSPSANEEDGYVSIFYNNRTYILNPFSGKGIVSFDSNVHYCVNNVEEDGNIITLNSCESFWGQATTYYKFIKNGKVYDLTDKCDKVYYNEENLICEKDYTKFLIDSNLNVGIDTSSKAYSNNDTYVMSAGGFDGVNFYNKGNVVKNVECRSLKETGYTKSNLYLLNTYYSRTCGTESGTYEFYKSNGEKAFEKSFKRAEVFDENGLAKVSDDGETYYLIDTTGKKISQNYAKIYSDNDYYEVENNDLKGLIDKDGNTILECLYSRIDISEKNGTKYAELRLNDSKYIVYDIQKKKNVIELDASPNLYQHYISVSKNSKTQYYAYNGKMFYETK